VALEFHLQQLAVVVVPAAAARQVRMARQVARAVAAPRQIVRDRVLGVSGHQGKVLLVVMALCPLVGVREVAAALVLLVELDQETPQVMAVQVFLLPLPEPQHPMPVAAAAPPIIAILLVRAALEAVATAQVKMKVTGLTARQTLAAVAVAVAITPLAELAVLALLLFVRLLRPHQPLVHQQ
jgi:hypothetical protein